MLLLLPKRSNAHYLLIAIAALAVNVLLALLVRSLIAPNAERNEPLSYPVYSMYSQQPETRIEPDEPLPVEVATAPNPAPARPSIVDFVLAESVTNVVLPKFTFEPQLSLEMSRTYQFNMSSKNWAEGSQIQASIAMAKPTFQVPPQYPQSAKRKGIEGNIALDLLIDEKGVPLQHRVVNESPEGVFLQSALRAVMRWRFVVPEKGQEWQRVVVNYQLEK